MAALWAAIGVLSIGAMALLLVPLTRQKREVGPARTEYDIQVYKDQLMEVDREQERGQLSEERANATKTEIQRRMLAASSSEEAQKPKDFGSNKAIMATLALLLPLGAVIMYFSLGTPAQKGFPLAERTNESAPAISQQDRDMVTKLAERLKENPDDQKGWVMLGNSFMAMEEYINAAKAYKKALSLDGKRLDIALYYAEALTFSSDDAIPDEALKLFEMISATEPYEPKSRYYLGLNKARMGDMKGALQEWVDLMAVGEKDAPWRKMIETQINNAAKVLKISPDSVKPSAKALELAKAKPANESPDQKGVRSKEIEAIAKMTPEEREALIRSMVERLAAKMENNPTDADGWRRLAKAYQVIGEEEKSQQARARAEALQK